MTAELALSAPERARRTECEAVIERGVRTFVETGTALLAMREERLYRDTHATFEDYCQDRWQFSRPRAYELMTAADVVSAMADTDVPPPANERQARELARTPEPERAEVWRETVERTNGKPTAAAVREVREEHGSGAVPEPLPPASPTAPEPSPAVTAFLDSDPKLQRARYLHEFMKVLTRSDDFMQFDPGKLAELADQDLVTTIDNHLIRVRNFAERFHRARPGLQVIHGGGR